MSKVWDNWLQFEGLFAAMWARTAVLGTAPRSTDFVKSETAELDAREHFFRRLTTWGMTSDLECKPRPDGSHQSTPHSWFKGERVREKRCFRVHQGRRQGKAVERDCQLADPTAKGRCGNMQDRRERRKCDENSKQQWEFWEPSQRSGKKQTLRRIEWKKQIFRMTLRKLWRRRRNRQNCPSKTLRAMRFENSTTVNMKKNIIDDFTFSSENREEFVGPLSARVSWWEGLLSQSAIDRTMQETESQGVQQHGLQETHGELRERVRTTMRIICILITDDSNEELDVVWQLEPFSLDGTPNAVMLIGSGIRDALGVFPSRIGACVWTNDCVVDGHKCGRHESCVDEHTWWLRKYVRDH